MPYHRRRLFEAAAHDLIAGHPHQVRAGHVLQGAAPENGDAAVVLLRGRLALHQQQDAAELAGNADLIVPPVRILEIVAEPEVKGKKDLRFAPRLSRRGQAECTVGSGQREQAFQMRRGFPRAPRLIAVIDVGPRAVRAERVGVAGGVARQSLPRRGVVRQQRSAQSLFDRCFHVAGSFRGGLSRPLRFPHVRVQLGDLRAQQ
jgi:hypothetical protein